LESTIKEIQHKMDESAAQMDIYYEEQLKGQKQDWEVGYFWEKSSTLVLRVKQSIYIRHN
jgi:hypothetical protein